MYVCIRVRRGLAMGKSGVGGGGGEECGSIHDGCEGGPMFMW